MILITDDDPTMRAFLHATLRRDGFETVQATNGREALERLETYPISVVLLDAHMPVLDGMATLERIRSHDRYRTLPVILITGSVGEAEEVHSLESGANDFLSKPVAPRQLMARVRAQLRGRTAWVDELERGRQRRRRLAEAVERLDTNASLLALVDELVTRLPAALDLDGIAILHFGADAVRSMGSSGVLRRRFKSAQVLPAAVGHDIAARAASGAWLESGVGPGVAAAARGAPPTEVAFVPYRLGATPTPLGCFAFALEPRIDAGPLSHRLPDLIDATDFVVALLRPAVARAETLNLAGSRIRQIVLGKEFEVHLQPIVRLETSGVVAVEALTRFTDGSPTQARFAEATTLGLSPLLELATAAAAIEAAAAAPSSIAVSINLSAEVLHEPELVGVLARAHRPVIVELTEHERIENYESVRLALQRLGDGVRLAIDDAGSGFASLRHIFALRPAFVKLDIEWVQGIDADPVRRALVSGLVYFASETGCELIAEGIETEAELKALRELGINLGQGYLLGRPAPASR